MRTALTRKGFLCSHHLCIIAGWDLRNLINKSNTSLTKSCCQQWVGKGTCSKKTPLLTFISFFNRLINPTFKTTCRHSFHSSAYESLQIPNLPLNEESDRQIMQRGDVSNAGRLGEQLTLAADSSTTGINFTNMGTNFILSTTLMKPTLPYSRSTSQISLITHYL